MTHYSNSSKTKQATTSETWHQNKLHKLERLLFQQVKPVLLVTIKIVESRDATCIIPAGGVAIQTVQTSLKGNRLKR